jgi:Protein of unknown function (DUF3987)
MREGAPIAGEEVGVSWPDPLPLPGPLLPVAAFDLAFLPDSLRDWVDDITERMQCPIDFVAMTAIAGLSAALGRKIGVRPQALGNWSEVANLWIACVGPSGSMKTPAMREAVSPLARLEALARIERGLGQSL